MEGVTQRDEGDAKRDLRRFPRSHTILSSKTPALRSPLMAQYLLYGRSRRPVERRRQATASCVS